MIRIVDNAWAGSSALKLRPPRYIDRYMIVGIEGEAGGIALAQSNRAGLPVSCPQIYDGFALQEKLMRTVRQKVKSPSRALSLAMFRVVVAVFVAVLAITEDSFPEIEVEGDDIAALCYLGFAVAMLAVGCLSWWYDSRLAPAMVAIDLVTFLVIPSLIEPIEAGYYMASIALALQIIWFSGLRWNGKAALVAAISINLMCLIVCLHLHMYIQILFGMPLSEMSFNEDLRRIVYLLIFSAFSVIAVSQVTGPSPKHYDPPAGLSLDQTLVDAVAYVRRANAYSSAILCWRWVESRDCATARSVGRDAIMVGTSQKCLDCLNDYGEQPFLFDVIKGRALVLEKSGSLRATNLTQSTAAFLDEMGLREGMALSFRGVSGFGRILVHGPAGLGWDQLDSFGRLGAELAAGLDRLGYQTLMRNMEVGTLRRSIARDMHDSVAQLLAGSQFWMESLKRKFPGQPALLDEVNQLQNSFRIEQYHVREIIARLMSEDSPSETIELIQSLEELIKHLSKTWSIQVALVNSPASLHVSERVAIETYHVVREAISNAVRHGGATRTEVSISEDKGSLRLSVIDDGAGGFERNSKPRSVLERAEFLGGTLEFYRQDGHTHCILTIPRAPL